MASSTEWRSVRINGIDISMVKLNGFIIFPCFEPSTMTLVVSNVKSGLGSRSTDRFETVDKSKWYVINGTNYAKINDIFDLEYVSPQTFTLENIKPRFDNVSRINPSYTRIQEVKELCWKSEDYSYMLTGLGYGDKYVNHNIANFDFQVPPIDMSYMFTKSGNYPNEINEILGLIDGSNVTSASHLFYYTDINGDFRPNITFTDKLTNLNHVFGNHSGGNVPLTGLDLNHWDVSNVTDFNEAFAGLDKLKSLNIDSWNCQSATDLGGLCFFNKTLTNDQFQYIVDKFNGAKVDNLHSTFSYCTNFEAVDMSRINTSNLTEISRTFEHTSVRDVADLHIENWDTSKVVSTQDMFNDCPNLTNADTIFNWSVPNLVMSYNMFSDCPLLTRIDFSKWQPQAVTNIEGMFKNDTSLQYVNLKGWKNSTEYAYCREMFANCTSLSEIHMEDWDWDVVRTKGSYKDMFKGVSAKIYVNRTFGKFRDLAYIEGGASHLEIQYIW